MVIFEPIWLLSKQASFFEAANSEVKIGLSLYNQTTITKFTQVKLALNRDKHCTVVHRLFDIQKRGVVKVENFNVETQTAA